MRGHPRRTQVLATTKRAHRQLAAARCRHLLLPARRTLDTSATFPSTGRHGGCQLTDSGDVASPSASRSTSRGRATRRGADAPRPASSRCRGRGRTRCRRAARRRPAAPGRRISDPKSSGDAVLPGPPGNSASPVNRWRRAVRVAVVQRHRARRVPAQHDHRQLGVADVHAVAVLAAGARSAPGCRPRRRRRPASGRRSGRPRRPAPASGRGAGGWSAPPPTAGPPSRASSSTRSGSSAASISSAWPVARQRSR